RARRRRGPRPSRAIRATLGEGSGTSLVGRASSSLAATKDSEGIRPDRTGASPGSAGDAETAWASQAGTNSWSGVLTPRASGAAMREAVVAAAAPDLPEPPAEPRRGSADDGLRDQLLRRGSEGHQRGAGRRSGERRGGEE